MKKLVHETKIIDTQEKLDMFLEMLDNPERRIIAFDTETDDLYGNLVGMSFCRDDHYGFYLPLDHSRGKNLDMELSLKKLKPYLEADDLWMVCHNVAYEIYILQDYGIDMQKFHDTMLMANLIDENMPKNLETRGEMEFDLEPLMHFKDMLAGAPNIKEVGIKKAGEYAVKDVIVTWMLFNKFKLDTEFLQFRETYVDLELPMAKIVAEMGRKGIMIDPPQILKIKREYLSKKEALETKIFYEASWNPDTEEYEAYQDGEGVWHGLVHFNLQSSQQKKAVFIDKLKCPVMHRTKTINEETGLGNPSFDSKIALPRYLRAGFKWAEYLMEWSKYTKVLQTYTDTLLEKMDDNNRIHPSFRQTGARTGRFSSSDPNFQSMPRGGVRDCFIAPEGYTLIGCDYDQLELRIAAHYSRDEAMIDSISHGKDLHTSNASFIFSILAGKHISEDDILENKRASAEAGESSMRDKVKAIAFSIQYGKREDLDAGITEEMVEAYLEKNHGLRDYMLLHDEFLFDHGYTRTFLGRKRRLKNVYDRFEWKRRKAYRQGFSGHIQGTAADIMKIAMRDMYKEIKDRGLDAHIIAQVHDEVLLECKNEYVEEVKEIVGRCMEGAVELRVPLTATPNHGRTWGEAK